MNVRCDAGHGCASGRQHVRVEMRVNKRIAASGIVSRREADKLIEQGRVSVNGVKLMKPGCDVDDCDEIMVDGKSLPKIEKKVYYMLNKPIGYITTVKDDRGRPTVLDLLKDIPERIFPVGRLDLNTSGLLFLTNDGEFAYMMTHPAQGVEKTYRLRVSGSIGRQAMSRLRRGVDIGDCMTAPARARLILGTKHSSLIELTIHEGKKRQVRRMMKSIGYPVQELERVAVGGIALGRLKTGAYRKLSPAEIEMLKSSVRGKKERAYRI